MGKIGKYKILEKIGEGGMGTVYKALQPILKKTVALKVLSEACAKDKEILERFLREARIMAGLPDYTHVVQVYDLDEYEGGYFYTMEYIPDSLAQMLGEADYVEDRTRRVKTAKKAIEVPLAVIIAEQLLKGLKVIHDAGIVHRDISPQNVMMVKCSGGFLAKLTDFGIAGIGDSQLTKSGMAGVGKEIYCAPEQLDDLSNANFRSDLYSVGILMYRMVTGKLPMGIRIKQANEINPDVSEELNEWILVATEQEPDDRFPDAETMLSELTKSAMGNKKDKELTIANTENILEGDGAKEPENSPPSEPMGAFGKHFLVICQECGKKYSIDASKVGDKGARFKCKACKNIVEVSKNGETASIASSKINLPSAREKQPENSPPSEPMGAFGKPFLVICQECGKKYSIDASKVGDKGARFKCKACKNIVEVSRNGETASIASSKINLPSAREKQLKFCLRNKPMTISSDDCQSVFNLDEECSPNRYIVNDYEDTGNGVVIDHSTGLMWEKSGSDDWLEYDEAENYIRKLNRNQFAGYYDWRLPTVDEMASLLEPEIKSDELYLDSIFDKAQEYCWTSDKNRGSGRAFVVDLVDGSFNCFGIAWESFVRAVRNL